MSTSTPPSNGTLTVIPVQRSEDPRPEGPRSEDPHLDTRALLPTKGQIIVRGPGVLARMGFNKLGEVLESVVTKCARAMRLGPECAATEVILFLGTGESRVRKLDELYHWQQGFKNTSKPYHPNPNPPDSIKKLQELCKTLIKYTYGCPPETRLLAFKRIVMLTTRFIGLRCIFVDSLVLKMRVTSLDQSALSRLWGGSASDGGSELDFFLKFAVYCITTSDGITLAVEECPPSHLGRSHLIQCVSENLIQSISSTDAKELSKLAATRYLGGILELATFWSQKINDGQLLQKGSVCAMHPPETIRQDRHSLSDGICNIGFILLEDLDMNGKDRVTPEDLIPFDTEGIRLLLDVYWRHISQALRFLEEGEPRTEESLRLVAQLCNLLQGVRSKCLFPIVAGIALKVLKWLEADSKTVSPMHSQTGAGPVGGEGSSAADSIHDEEAAKEDEPQGSQGTPESVDDEHSATGSIHDEESTREDEPRDSQGTPGSMDGERDANEAASTSGSTLSAKALPKTNASKTINKADDIIAVMGATGTGKSTFINLISGSKLRVGADLEACTGDVEATAPFTFQGRKVVLFDMPGFDDTTKSDSDILLSITTSLVKIYENGQRLAGLVYMHRISTDVHMGGTAMHNFNIFRTLCGDGSLKNVAIVTNFWSEVTPAEGAEREKLLQAVFFKPALDKQAKLLRHDGTRASASTIIAAVTGNAPIALDIQTELVDANKSILETAVGTELNGAGA